LETASDVTAKSFPFAVSMLSATFRPDSPRFLRAVILQTSEKVSLLTGGDGGAIGLRPDTGLDAVSQFTRRQRKFSE
jgi:hypothetical protein